MPYVHGDKFIDNVNEMKLDELYCSLKNLENEVEKISLAGVVTFDSHEDNYFWDEEEKRIRIIDTEFYAITENKPLEQNLARNNQAIGKIIGLRDKLLRTYINNNSVYQITTEKNKKIELTPSKILEKIQEQLETEMGAEICTLGELKDIIKGKENIYEKNMYQWSEGCSGLYNVLDNARENGVTTKYCCAGHTWSDFPYITFEYTDKTKDKLHNVLNDVSLCKNIQLSLSNNGQEKTPSLTIYTKNTSNKSEIFETIAQALYIERDIEEPTFPQNIRELINLKDIFESQGHNYNISYDLEKRELMLDRIKNEYGISAQSSKMKALGFKKKEDMLGNKKYIQKLSKGEKEIEKLSRILEGITDIYDYEYMKKETILDKIKNKFKQQKLLAAAKPIPEEENKFKNSLKAIGNGGMENITEKSNNEESNKNKDNQHEK